MKTLDRKKLSEVTPLPSLTMSERLKVVRKSRDMTQQEMADLIGTSRPSIAQLEAGRHQPSNEALETIVAKLSISRNWLWFGSGPMEEFSPLGGNVKVLAGLEEGDYLDVEFVGCKVRGSFLDLMDDGGGISSSKAWTSCASTTRRRRCVSRVQRALKLTATRWNRSCARA